MINKGPSFYKNNDSKPNSLSCKYCSFHTKYPKDLLNHIEQFHIRVGEAVECYLCPAKFATV
jgi:hypothetical protein